LLDVGCGRGDVLSQLKRMDKKDKMAGLLCIGVDIFEDYLYSARKWYNAVILADVRYLPIRTACADIVLASDLIEHLHKKEGVLLLEDMERICRKQLIVFTPNGANPKKRLEDANPWQCHKSAWKTREFAARGFTTMGVNGFKLLYGERCELRSTGKLVSRYLGIVAQLSKPIVYYLPPLAYQILCVKLKSASPESRVLSRSTISNEG
jgi:SAM-dependent methyltransferase